MPVNGSLALHIIRLYCTITMCFLINGLLIDQDYKSRAMRRVFYALWGLVYVCNGALILAGHYLSLIDCIILTAYVPIFVVYFLCTRCQLGQMLTFWFTGMFVFYLVSSLGVQAATIAGGSVLVDLLVRVAVFLPIYIYLRKKVRPKLPDFKRALEAPWRYIWIAPLLIVLLIHNLLFVPTFFAGEYDRYPGIWIAYLLSLSVFICIYYVFRATVTQTETTVIRGMLKTQMTALEGQLAALQEREAAARMFRHDNRQNSMVLCGLLHEGRAEEALAYLSAQEEACRALEAVRYCANPVVNALIMSYSDRAKKQRTSLHCQISLDERPSIDMLEICIVIGNLLENSLNACAALPAEANGGYVSLKITQGEAQLLLEIENPYAGLIRFDENKLPVSPNPEGGFGVKSVAMTVHRYHGMLQFTAKDQVFFAKMTFSYDQAVD